MSNKEFRLKNLYVDGLMRWLNNLALVGAESRSRTAFIDILAKHLVSLQRQRELMVAKYAKKDEEGNPEMIVTADGKKTFDVSDESMKALNEESVALMNEDMVLDLTGDVEVLFQEIRKIVLFTDYKFGPKDSDSDAQKAMNIKMAYDYYEWCKAFSAVVV